MLMILETLKTRSLVYRTHRAAWPLTEQAAAEQLHAYACANRQVFGGWVKRWLLRLGKTQSGDLHKALRRMRMVKEPRRYTERLLEGQGELSIHQMRVMLRVAEVSVFYALMDLELATPPPTQVPVIAFTVEALLLVDLLRDDAAKHAAFDGFARAWLLPGKGKIRACAEYLAKMDILKGRTYAHNHGTLIGMLRGHKAGCRVYLNLSALMGICAFARVSSAEALETFTLWCNEHEAGG